MELVFEQIELLRDFAESNDLELTTDYSGRGMYGTQCIGFIGDINAFKLGFDLRDFLNDFIADGNELGEDLLDTLRNSKVCMDNMGRDSIIYFPNIKYIDDEI